VCVLNSSVSVAAIPAIWG